ncbi:MAG: D-lyxose/D-mannose family sugar isomerase [Ruminococcaceae bacterium]|nr:D-lyxose/D-mannose family sugar isomerase [Oscillospiraceae bacterium]
MKRSDINRYLAEAVVFIGMMNFKFPPFAYWTPEEWLGKGPEFDEIRENMLGWDITDFGSGSYTEVGLLLFTLRNGSSKKQSGSKPYAEKIMVVREGQVTPLHFHSNKMEDIINRGGGNLLVDVYNATIDHQIADSEVTIRVDGHARVVKAGSVIRLRPGESIALPTHQYHRFRAEQGFGMVLAGEVSQVNDDTTDNYFYKPAGRFPNVIADEAPRYLLCHEYPPAAGLLC